MIQKRSGPWAFKRKLWHVLGATAACTFWAAQRPNVLRTWGVFRNMTLKCAWGFGPAALAILLFDPPEPQTLEKSSVSRFVFTFSRAWCFYFPFSDSSQDCCCICPYIGSLTSNFPSIVFSFNFLRFLNDTIHALDLLILFMHLISPMCPCWFLRHSGYPRRTNCISRLSKLLGCLASFR